MGGWVVSRYDDVVALLHDGRLLRNRGGSEDGNAKGAHRAEAQLDRVFGKQMLFLDPPDHARLRGLLNKTFTPAAVAQMRDCVQRLVDDRLDAVQASGRMDVVVDLAHPLPFTVIRETLGLAREDEPRLRTWSDAYAAFLGNIPPSSSERECAARSVTELAEHLREHVACGRGQAGATLLAAIAAAEDDGRFLDEDELVGTVLLFLVAGHETTTGWIGNGLLALLRATEQLERLRAEPALLSTAAAEVLRLESPVQFTAGRARDDFECRGQRIARGDFVFLLLAAANRDPEAFPDPDRLDIARAPNRHLAFGHGPHFCIGAPLARLEAECALRTVLRRMPRLQLAKDRPPRWRLSMGFRSLASLDVCF
jgi:hypothetical protein